MSPYKMVYINVLLSLLVSIPLFFYLKSKPKKIHYLLLLIIISLLPLISILRPGTYESGDLSINVIKTMSFYSSLKEGIVIPTWAGELNATYGYPNFLFAYPLPYYIASFFHFIGFSFINSVKLVLASSFILSGIGMYFWAKNEIGEKGGFIASIFYLFAPYHLVNMHFRVDIGEMVAFVFLPLSLFFVKKLSQEYKMIWFLGNVMSIFLLILSHQAISLVSAPLIIIYILYLLLISKKERLQKGAIMLSSFILGLGAAAYYWLPVIIEGAFTNQALYAKVVEFAHFLEFFYSPWRYGLLFQGPYGELSFIIGYVQWFIIIVAISLLVKRKVENKYKKLLLLFLSIFFFIFFSMQQIAKPLWDSVPIMKNFQFTYRLLAFEVLITSIIAGIVLSKYVKSQKMVILLCAITVLSTILNWGNRRNITSVTDAVLLAGLPLSTAHGEGLQPASPKWTLPDSPWMSEIPKNHLEILSGKGTIRMLNRKNNEHSYRIDAKTPLRVRENTLYFPGWEVLNNNKQFHISISNNPPGVMTFKLEKGTSYIRVLFKDTPIRSLGKQISTTVFLFLVLLLLVDIRRRFQPKT